MDRSKAACGTEAAIGVSLMSANGKTSNGKFRGSFTALVTPFQNGQLDEKGFRDLVEWQIAEGTDGLVPVGTTGESPTLSHDEHHKVVEWCIDQARGRVPVIAGAGSNSTAEAVALSRHAEKAGADAVLVVTPYYNKPTQEGMYPALQGGERRDRHSDHHLQHPAPLGGRHVGRHHEAAVRIEEHRRRQGRDRQSRARVAAAPGDGSGFHPALGRGHDRARLQCRGRPWLHLGGVECRARALQAIAGH